MTLDDAPLIASVAVSAFVVHAAAGILAQSAQPPSTARRFEVASVKPALTAEERSRLAAQTGTPASAQRYGIRTQPGGRFLAGSTLKQLIAEAFEVKDYQIDGGPQWLATDRFEITANAGADATPADVKAMLRTLLAERFGLRTSNDTRQAPMYVLTVVRSDGRPGRRLTPTTPECIKQIEQRRDGTAPITKPQASAELEREPLNRTVARMATVTPRCGWEDQGRSAKGVSTLLFGGMELTRLVTYLSGVLSAPVLDRTDLTGLFDVGLEYLSEQPINGRVPGLDPNSADPLPPALTGALQQQLGLKLERQIGPMPVVVIEAAERPTPD